MASFEPYFLPQLTQLPNGDLWRGVPPADAEEPESNVEAPTKGSIDDVMEQVVKSARGQKTLSCLWCGQQYNRQDYALMRDHITHLHAKATAPADDKDKLMAALKLAQEELVAANEPGGTK